MNPLIVRISAWYHALTPREQELLNTGIVIDVGLVFGIVGAAYIFGAPL